MAEPLVVLGASAVLYYSNKSSLMARTLNADEVVSAVKQAIEKVGKAWWFTDRRQKIQWASSSISKLLALHSFGMEETALWFAQVLHESGAFWYTREQKPGNYENRRDLGNTQPGDGALYIGRGFVQITGRDNYTRYGEFAGVDTASNPALLETSPFHAAQASIWYWLTYQAKDTGRTCRDVARDSSLSSSEKVRRTMGIIYAGREKLSNGLFEKGSGKRREDYAKAMFEALSVSWR